MALVPLVIASPLSSGCTSFYITVHCRISGGDKGIRNRAQVYYDVYILSSLMPFSAHSCFFLSQIHTGPREVMMIFF